MALLKDPEGKPHPMFDALGEELNLKMNCLVRDPIFCEGLVKGTVYLESSPSPNWLRCR